MLPNWLYLEEERKVYMICLKVPLERWFAVSIGAGVTGYYHWAYNVGNIFAADFFGDFTEVSFGANFLGKISLSGAHSSSRGYDVYAVGVTVGLGVSGLPFGIDFSVRSGTARISTFSNFTRDPLLNLLV